MTAETDDDTHTVTICLRQTRLAFSVEGHPVHSGLAAAGTMQISGPGQSESAEFSAACDELRLYVPNRLLQSCHEAVHGRTHAGDIVLVDPRFARDATIDRLRFGLLAADEMGGPHGRLCAEGIGLAVVARLLEVHSNCSRTVERPKAIGLVKWRMTRARDYIEANLDEPIHLADIAAAAGLSRMHFAAQFRVATGLRPHEFVLRRRIERAQELLSGPRAALADVALSVGFLTQAHFTTVFRRFVGQTPLRWRQLNMVAAPAIAARRMGSGVLSHHG